MLLSQQPVIVLIFVLRSIYRFHSELALNDTLLFKISARTTRLSINATRFKSNLKIF